MNVTKGYTFSERVLLEGGGMQRCMYDDLSRYASNLPGRFYGLQAPTHQFALEDYGNKLVFSSRRLAPVRSVNEGLKYEN